MFEHFKRNRKSATWTKQHQAVAILEVISMKEMSQGDCAKYESAKTIDYMMQFGLCYVRGGHYCSMNNEVINTLICKHGFVYKNRKLSEKCVDKNECMKRIEELHGMENLIKDDCFIK